MSRSRREALPHSGSGQEALSDVLSWTVVPLGCSRLVEMASRMSVSGRETLPVVLSWSGVPPGCPGVIEWP